MGKKRKQLAKWKDGKMLAEKFLCVFARDEAISKIRSTIYVCR